MTSTGKTTSPTTGRSVQSGRTDTALTFSHQETATPVAADPTRGAPTTTPFQV